VAEAVVEFTLGAYRLFQRLPQNFRQTRTVEVVGLGLGAFTASLEEADRYTGLRKADWIPTNMWLKSAECARLQGVWLAICDDDKLVPISEHSFGDDPRHALFLGIWAMATDDRVSLEDVAGLNIALNTAGFILLASILFAIRAYVTSIMFLWAGPVIFLRWIGVSPHWGFIGVTSLVLVLLGNPVGADTRRSADERHGRAQGADPGDAGPVAGRCPAHGRWHQCAPDRELPGCTPPPTASACAGWAVFAVSSCWTACLSTTPPSAMCKWNRVPMENVERVE
jgi:hypothetical protein